MDNDPRVTIFGIVALNNLGQVCVFTHSRADGIVLPDEFAKQVPAWARKVLPGELGRLDPQRLGGLVTEDC